MLWQAIIYLALAIACEIAGTICLRLSDGFSKWPYIIGIATGYGLAFWFLSLSLKLGMPLGLAYAIWAGLGTAIIAVVGILVFKEPLALLQWLGICCIIVGVVLLNLGGKVSH
ncbi:DMT family transporter [Alkanindiges illinoisensis]|uniref:DMT family transporter n=1 Tax=Alkanindiges illinoisensis TaxID=197183 RepID=UPI00047B2310|nr:multidrug efflux SMR transporter [Alkanindiges illinoisensis]